MRQAVLVQCGARGYVAHSRLPNTEQHAERGRERAGCRASGGQEHGHRTWGQRERVTERPGCAAWTGVGGVGTREAVQGGERSTAAGAGGAGGGTQLGLPRHRRRVRWQQGPSAESSPASRVALAARLWLRQRRAVPLRWWGWRCRHRSREGPDGAGRQLAGCHRAGACGPPRAGGGGVRDNAAKAAEGSVGDVEVARLDREALVGHRVRVPGGRSAATATAGRRRRTASRRLRARVRVRRHRILAQLLDLETCRGGQW